MEGTIKLPDYNGLTKTTAALQAQLMVDDVEEGIIAPLDALAKLTWLSAAVEQAIKQIRPLALDEASMYPRASFADYGAEYQVKETGIRYDYSQFEEWRQCNEQLDAMKLELKQLEERLRKTTVVPKQSTTTICVTLKK